AVTPAVDPVRPAANHTISPGDKLMRNMFCVTLVASGALFLLSPAAHAGWFGEDDMLLAQLVQNSVQELVQLKTILQNGSDTLGLLQDVNRGITDSLQLASSLGIPVS